MRKNLKNIIKRRLKRSKKRRKKKKRKDLRKRIRRNKKRNLKRQLKMLLMSSRRKIRMVAKILLVKILILLRLNKKILIRQLHQIVMGQLWKMKKQLKSQKNKSLFLQKEEAREEEARKNVRCHHQENQLHRKHWNHQLNQNIDILLCLV